APGDAPDAGHDAGARRLVVVAAVRGERRELEEGRPRVEEARDALARQELPAGGVAAARLLGATCRRPCARRAEGLHQPLHVCHVGAELGIGRADPGWKAAHQRGAMLVMAERAAAVCPREPCIARPLWDGGGAPAPVQPGPGSPRHAIAALYLRLLPPHRAASIARRLERGWRQSPEHGTPGGRLTLE